MEKRYGATDLEICDYLLKKQIQIEKRYEEAAKRGNIHRGVLFG